MEFTREEREAISKRITSAINIFGVMCGNETKRAALTWNHLDFVSETRKIKDGIARSKQETFNELFGPDGPADLVFRLTTNLVSTKTLADEPANKVLVTELCSAREVEELVKRIVAEIESFPRKYRAFFGLQPHDIFSTIGISTSSVNIIFLDEQSHLLYPELQGDAFYLTIDREGYASSLYNDTINAVFQDRLFSLLGVSLAANALELTQQQQEKHDSHFPYHIFDMSSPEKPQFQFSLSLPAAASDVFTRLAPTQGFENVATSIISLINFEHSIPHKVSAVKQIFSASRWYFDSIAEVNQTHSYINTMIGMEILLGKEKESEQLTARLADCFSYMIAPSRARRNYYHNKFLELYKLRSKIVHRGEVLLPAREAGILNDAKLYLKLIIFSEIHQLIQDNYDLIS